MSASIKVVSTRRRRERNTLRSTASASSSALSSSSSSGPSRLVSFISVLGSGTRPTTAIRQKRRHLERVGDFLAERLIAQRVPMLEVHQPQVALDRDRRTAAPSGEAAAERGEETVVVED